VKGYPFEVALNTRTVAGVALIDQIKSLDWRARMTHDADEVSAVTLRAARQRIVTFLDVT